MKYTKAKSIEKKTIIVSGYKSHEVVNKLKEYYENMDLSVLVIKSPHKRNKLDYLEKELNFNDVIQYYDNLFQEINPKTFDIVLYDTLPEEFILGHANNLDNFEEEVIQLYDKLTQVINKYDMITYYDVDTFKVIKHDKETPREANRR